MKLKPQPRPTRRPKASSRPARAVRGRARLGGGRQASRPGAPMRRRLSGRLPSMRRFIAGVGAVAAAAGLVALLNGPWLRVTDVAWAGERLTPAGQIGEVLESANGTSVLAVDTRGLSARIERLPSVASASVAVSLTGRVEATVVEREPAFVWETASARFVGAADGTIFSGGRSAGELPDALEGLPRIRDERFVARVVTVGDVIPEALARVALRVASLDPTALGSDADRLTVRIDDEYGFRIASSEPEWEIALGVYGLDPNETSAEADARLERQVTAVRTLFTTRAEEAIGWVDVRNPGKVYFRAKG